jgi:hypothetical protein
MYAKNDLHHFFRLNELIKNDLLESQRLLDKAIIEPKECPNEGCYKPSFIQIRDKINFFEDISPQEELTDQQISSCLERWLISLRYHRIILLFNDNETDIRERYQFIVEEFLNMELPPHPSEMQFCFIYDKINSTKVIQTSETLIGRILHPLLNTDKVGVFNNLNKRVRLNEFDNLSEPELHYVVDRYQQKFEKIINNSYQIESKKLVNNRLVYRGKHQTGFCFQSHCNIISGGWQIELIPCDGSWIAVDIQIEGVEL